MADKKRAPAKLKKTKAKTKVMAEETELKTKEENLDEEHLLEAEVDSDDRGNTAEQLAGDAEDSHREGDASASQTYERPAPRTSLSDEYTIQSYFDKSAKQFVATVVEFPELRVTGTNRQMVLSELQEKIEDELYELKSRGQFITEPVQSRVYPERLDVAVSQSIYRKLDLLSRQEKLPIDRLVGEILANALGRKPEGRRDNRPPQHSHGGGGQHHGGNHQQNRHQQNRHHGGQHGGQQRHSRGGNPRDIESRENFMEYVRNLEKGGGPNWKKR